MKPSPLSPEIAAAISRVQQLLAEEAGPNEIFALTITEQRLFRFDMEKRREVSFKRPWYYITRWSHPERRSDCQSFGSQPTIEETWEAFCSRVIAREAEALALMDASEFSGGVPAGSEAPSIPDKSERDDPA